jgi:hypothetical protein
LLFSILLTKVSFIIAITRFIIISEMNIYAKKCKTNWKSISFSRGKSAGNDIDEFTGNSTGIKYYGE